MIKIMSSFPLYMIILDKVKFHDKDLSETEKLKTIKIISHMDTNEHKNLFILIRIYNIRNNNFTYIFFSYTMQPDFIYW